MFRLVLAVICLWPSALVGQGHWTLTVERGWTTYSSASHDTSASPVHLRPWRPAVYSIRVAHGSGRFGLAIGAGVAFGEWGVNIEDFVLLPDESLQLIEIAPEVNIRLATSALGTVLRLHAGPLLDLWKPSGEDPRQRLGAQAGATLSVPFASRWALDVRGDVAVSRSLMNEDEESAAITRESTMRRGRLALGITRRL
jgi:hypothetical protein